ncbi:MAG: hypothetical protein M3126_11015, partial [Candidatus Eremiobacteraeota bacterium]|nr:hypothetical protein [Candidatus Eremiobacteraeota bacterium]
MRRTPGLAALCLLSTLWFAGCGTSSHLNAPVASPTPFIPKVTGEVAVPSAGSVPTAIARAFDGNLWFTEQATNKVAKIAVGSTVTITEPVQLAAG